MSCCGAERNHDIILPHEIAGTLGFLKWDKTCYHINNTSMRTFVSYKCIIYIPFEKLSGSHLLTNAFNDVPYIEHFVFIKWSISASLSQSKPPPLKAHACNINSSLHFMQNWAYVKLHLHLPLLPNNNIFKHHFYLRQWAIDITV